MRENKIGRAGIKALKTTYLVKGLNLDRFINTLKKSGIDLYDIKKPSNKRLYVTVNFSDRQKFFAIAKELCYNIKKVRDGGKALFLLKAYRSIGVLIGAAVIALTAVYCDDLIFAFEFTGSGKLYKREVEAYLQTQGVEKFSRFSDIDLSRLEDGVLANIPYLSFASCEKVGCRLVFDLALSTEKVETLKGNVYALYSDCDGVVESVKVYRGTALVEQGQAVKKGDLLVDGFAVIKEQTVKINVLAVVTVITGENFIYRSKKNNDQEKAIIFAQERCDYEPVSSAVNVTKDGEEYVYTVTLKFKRVMRAG